MHEVVGSKFHAYDTTALLLRDRRGHTCVFVDALPGQPLGSETCRYLKRTGYNQQLCEAGGFRMLGEGKRLFSLMRAEFGYKEEFFNKLGRLLKQRKIPSCMAGKLEEARFCNNYESISKLDRVG